MYSAITMSKIIRIFDHKLKFIRIFINLHFKFDDVRTVTYVLVRNLVSYRKTRRRRQVKTANRTGEIVTYCIPKLSHFTLPQKNSNGCKIK